MIRAAHYLCLLLALAWASPAAAEPAPTVITGRTMGTTYRIKYWGGGEASQREIRLSIERLLAAVDRQMSTYREDSELSQFNRAPAGEWLEVSPATAAVVAQALKFHEFSSGVYDVTVGPALRLWNFGPGADGDRELAPPSEEELDAVRGVVGSQHLGVRTDPPALRKAVAGIEIDLSSIAPGYAVDEIIHLLADAGFDNAIVEIGGEVRAVGVNHEGAPWLAGVEAPAVEPPKLAQVVPLRELALSTSGDYRNFRVMGGKRYAHVLDPRTLRPLLYRRMSVTVLAATCAEADALGTALLVMGPDAGRQWCIEHDVAAMFQTRAGDGRVERVGTPRFSRSLLPEGTSAKR